MSFKSVRKFLRNVANRQTDKQVDKQWRKNNLLERRLIWTFVRVILGSRGKNGTGSKLTCVIKIREFLKFLKTRKMCILELCYAVIFTSHIVEKKNNTEPRSTSISFHLCHFSRLYCHVKKGYQSTRDTHVSSHSQLVTSECGIRPCHTLVSCFASITSLSEL